MIAPLPKRRSICCSARSMAFSRSVVAAETIVPLRSAIDFSFLVIGNAYYRVLDRGRLDRKSTRLNSSHTVISYAVFCLKKKKRGFHSNKTYTIYWVCGLQSNPLLDSAEETLHCSIVTKRNIRNSGSTFSH